MSLSVEEQKIEVWYKGELQKLFAMKPESGNAFSLIRESEIELSNEYKHRHQILIDQRKADEQQNARMQAFDASHSQRLCRECNTPLPSHVGRGRPPVRCEEHHGLAG